MAGMSSFGVGKTIFSGSAAVTNSHTTPDFNTDTAYGQIPVCEAVDLILSVTAHTGAGGANTGWVGLETSPDGGTTWVPFARFAQITTSTALQRISLRTNGLGANEAAAASGASLGTATAAITQNCVITRHQRLVYTAANALEALTFKVFAVVQQAGSRSRY